MTLEPDRSGDRSVVAATTPTPADSAPAGVATPRRIVVMAHFVYAGRVGGAEHMLYNLLRGLWRRDIALDVLCARVENIDASFRREAEAQPNVRVLASGKGGPRFLTEQLTCLDPAYAADAIIFPNYFVPPLVPRRLGAVVCVLHDLQYRHLQENFSRRKRLWLRLAHSMAIRRCDRMIVISEFVRQDAIRHLGERFAERIDVVPNPVSWDRFGPPRQTGEATRAPCILSLAAQYGHKNLPTLIRAFAILVGRPGSPGRWANARLVLCGQDHGGLHGVAGSQGDLTALSRALGVGERVEFTGYIDDEALGQRFREATVFAFPSVFEGFGMPPVEALGLGLPTLVTRRTSLPEVTLGLAHYVDDPFDAVEWADRLDAMLADPAGHAPSEADIAALRARYSPGRIAAEYVDVCCRAAR